MSVGIIVGVIAIAMVLYVMLVTIGHERKLWNKGVCCYCNKDIWVSFDVDSGGATGYKCGSCGASTWISYNSAYKG